MRARLRLAVLLLACLVPVAPARAQGKVHGDRIRPLDPHLQLLLHDGLARSETFRALVTRLRGGDVVVYMRYETLPAGVHGQLTFLAGAGGLRYVMVAISPELDVPRSIGIIAHELQHAVEIVEQPQIVDADTFAVAYAQATYRRRHLAHGRIGYDTRAAVHAGVQVWKELAVAPNVLFGTR